MATSASQAARRRQAVEKSKKGSLTARLSLKAFLVVRKITEIWVSMRVTPPPPKTPVADRNSMSSLWSSAITVNRAPG